MQAHSFEVDVDSSGFSAYISGGIVTQVKESKVLSFQPLADALKEPGEFLLTDFAKLERSPLLHIGFQALDAFTVRPLGSTFPSHTAYSPPINSDGLCDGSTNAPSVSQAEKGRLPEPGSLADAKSVLEMATQLNDAVEVKAEIDEEVLKLLAFGASGDLNAMAAMFGGIVGQEVVKAATGKFHPLYQWLYFDSVESLPATELLTPEECAPQVCCH